MAMTREDMRDEVRENIKRTVSGVSAARIDRWLDWGKDYIADLHTYEEMRETFTASTVANQDNYGFPTRMKDIYSLVLRDGASSRKLIYTTARNFDEKIPRPLTHSTGKPDYYIDYGVNFELFRVPDTTYPLILRCSLYPADFATDASTCDLVRKDALICAIATVFGFWTLRELEDATYWGSQMVPSLYEASLTSDHSAEDWTPIARGFGQSHAVTLSGQWWTNPFTGRGV